MRLTLLIISAARKIAFLTTLAWLFSTPINADAGTFVRFITTRGTMVMQLFDDVMPRSVDNFLSYVNSDRYNNTIVHRNGFTQGGTPFIIQGGNFTYTNADGLGTIPLDPAIDLEPGGGSPGPSNVRGTISFAKQNFDPDSVTSQWFINMQNNSFLDNTNQANGGFAAFGAILLNGMSVAETISSTPRFVAASSYEAPESTPGQQIWPGTEVPLLNYTGPQPLDGSGLTEANFTYILDASVINPRSGDFNLNGFVDDQDLAILTSNYGMASGALWDNGDLDMDGDVDGADLLGWQRGYRPPPAVSGVPEPASFALAAGGFAALGFARRRKHQDG